MKIRTTIAALVACLALAVPGTAFAGSPTEDAYNGVSPQQESGGSGTEGTSTEGTSTSPEPASVEVQQSSSGSLPFTGFEAGIAALIGLGLLAGGVALYRVSRRSQPQKL